MATRQDGEKSFAILSSASCASHRLERRRGSSLIELTQYLLNGISQGCVYVLLASGLTILLGIMNVPNFAQGHLYMVAAYLGFYMVMSYCDELLACPRARHVRDGNSRAARLFPRLLPHKEGTRGQSLCGSHGAAHDPRRGSALSLRNGNEMVPHPLEPERHVPGESVAPGCSA